MNFGPMYWLIVSGENLTINYMQVFLRNAVIWRLSTRRHVSEYIHSLKNIKSDQICWNFWGCIHCVIKKEETLWICTSEMFLRSLHAHLRHADDI